MIPISLSRQTAHACVDYAKAKIEYGIGDHSTRLSIRGADKDWIPWAQGKQVEHGVAIWLGVPESHIDMDPRSRGELDGIDMTSPDGFTIDAKYSGRDACIWSAGKSHPRDLLPKKRFQIFVVGRTDMILVGDSKTVELHVLVERRDFMARRIVAGANDSSGFDQHTQYLSFRDCCAINQGDTLPILLAREARRQSKTFEFVSGRWP